MSSHLPAAVYADLSPELFQVWNFLTPLGIIDDCGWRSYFRRVNHFHMINLAS
jgi:hypothetical protein